MNVLMINGSAKEKGCTYTALSELAKVFDSYGINSEIIHLGTSPIRDCTGCGVCRKNPGKCVFDDDLVNEVLEKAKHSDGFIFGSPVYYAHPSGRILSFLDRLFYSGNKFFQYKPGAVVLSARRAGTSASFDVLNKYLTINRMPVVSSQYWNMVHGSCPEDVLKDEEGLQIMRTLAENMVWLLQCIKAGKSAGIDYPQPETAIRTSFIR